MSFETFNFDEALVKAIGQAKFTQPSKVQKLVIPEILAGNDIIASAHSGSGKSASFILPLIQLLLNAQAHSRLANFSDIENDNFINQETYLEKTTEDGNGDADNDGHDYFDHESDNDNPKEALDKPKNGPKILILAPTRELANQISASIRRFTKDLGLRYGILVGGAPYPPQVRMLKKPVDFLVATPGRLLDHLKNNRVNFDKIEILVIDETDRMIDMKMHEDLLEIYSYIPKSQTLANGDIKLRQTLLFAGSLEGESLTNISKEFQNNPLRFELARSKQSYRNLQQSMYIADEGEHKFKLCQAVLHQTLIEKSTTKNVIIYSTESNNLYNLATFLINQLPDLTRVNETLLAGPDNQHIVLLVDEQSFNASLIDHEMHDLKIIHLDLPDDILDFLHRLEPAIDQASAQEINLLIGKNEWPMLHQIERYIGKTLSRKKITGLEPVSTEPSVGSQISSGKFTNLTKNRNPYSGRRQNKSNSQRSQSRNKNQPSFVKSPTAASEIYFENMNSNDLYNEQQKGNIIDSGNQKNVRKKVQSARKTSHRSPNTRSHTPDNNAQRRTAAGINKITKPNPRKRNKSPNNSSNPQLVGNTFNSESLGSDHDLSWKQYISNISNGNAPSKTAKKKFINKHRNPKGGFDLNHSPMAISAKKVRDIAQNEEWASEKKEASKPSVQIRVKASVRIKGVFDNSTDDNQKSYSDFDVERIDGKLGINK